ncbi:hypothetical protein B6K89_21365 [Bacillus subtilis]|nr:hypothetical protein B6K89_21365 [Bacillus subtilis]
MDSSLIKQTPEPIVGLACKDRSGKFHIIRNDEPLHLDNIIEHNNMIQMKNIHIPYRWFESIIICTEENLQELKHAL